MRITGLCSVVYQITNHWNAAQKSSVDLQSQIQCLTEELSVMQTEKDRVSVAKCHFQFC